MKLKGAIRLRGLYAILSKGRGLGFQGMIKGGEVTRRKWEIRVILVRPVYANSSCCWLPISRLRTDLFFSVVVGAPSQREIYALLLGRQEEDRELFLHLLTLRCPQMKIIFVSKWHIWWRPILTPLTISSMPFLCYSFISCPSCFFLTSCKHAQISLISMILPMAFPCSFKLMFNEGLPRAGIDLVTADTVGK